MPLLNSKDYVQHIKTSIVKFHIIISAEMEKEQTVWT